VADALGHLHGRLDVGRGRRLAGEAYLGVDRLEAGAAGDRVDDDRDGI